jgi:hypothetical protein
MFVDVVDANEDVEEEVVMDDCHPLCRYLTKFVMNSVNSEMFLWNDSNEIQNF